MHCAIVSVATWRRTRHEKISIYSYVNDTKIGLQRIRIIQHDGTSYVQTHTNIHIEILVYIGIFIYHRI